MIEKEKYITLKLIKSKIGCIPNHKATLIGLGLNKINDVVKVKNNSINIGMIKKVSYLLDINYS